MYTDHLNQGLGPAHEVSRRSVDVPAAFDKRAAYDLGPLGRKYDRQYFSMYQHRLQTLKPRVDRQAARKWGRGDKKIDGQTITHVDKILNIRSNQLCWVSGTVFADLKNKLDILGDVEKGVDDVLPAPPSTYVTGHDDEEVVMLEDESGRAILQGEDLKKSILVTGVIVAVLGIELQAGIFEIVDVVYPEMAPQRPLGSGSGKIAFVSGLLVGDDYDLKLALLKQYLCGQLGNDNDKQAAAQIGHLIVAGNSVREVQPEVSDDFTSVNNYGSKNVSKVNVDSLKTLDAWVGDIVASCNVTLIPGETDPTEICLPQQPLHPAFFPNSRSVLGNNLKLCTNPAWLEVAGTRILGTSGVNVQDVTKYLAPARRSADLPLQIMKSMIQWQNIVPTAPDTLYCYPFEDSDPFTLEETPHVVFAGNQPQFAAELVQWGDVKVNLVSIPNFSATGQLVVMDLATLETSIVQLQI